MEGAGRIVTELPVVLIPEQKEELAAGLIGVPAKSLKDVLSKSVGKISCVYRFVLGECKNLRKTMKIPKDIPDNYLITK